MRYPRVHSIFDTIRPIEVVAKINLLFFGTYDVQHRIIRRTLFDQFCSILAVLVDLYLMQVGIRGNSGFLTMTDSYLLNVGIYGTIVLSSAFGLSLSSIIQYKGAIIFQLIDRIAEFDDEMLKLGFSVDHQRSHRHSVLSMCWVLSTAVSAMIISLTFDSDNSWLNLSAIFPNHWTMIAFIRSNCGSIMFGCIFCLTLMFLKIRYSLLNEAMAYVDSIAIKSIIISYLIFAGNIFGR